jgi:hypothetical protein
LHMEFLQMPKRSTYAYLSPQLSNPCIDSAGQWLGSLWHTIWEGRMKRRQLVWWHIVKQEDFPGFSEASITWTGHVWIIHLRDKVYSKGHYGYCSVVLEVMEDYDLWIWYTFLVWRVLTMTSTCCSGHRCLIDSLNAMLHLETMWLMAPKDTI